MKCSPVLIALLAFALPAGAQVPCGPPGVTATVDPQVAAPGQSIDVTLTNLSSQSIALFDSCVFQGVFPNATCTLPAIDVLGCLQIITPIPAGQSLSESWDQTDPNGQQVPNGTYSFQISHDSGLCCATVTIAEGAPALTRWGMSALVGFAGLAGIWALQKRRALPE